MDKEPQKISAMVAIKRYFMPDEKLSQVKAELLALSKEEKEELGKLCAIELGCELNP